MRRVTSRQTLSTQQGYVYYNVLLDLLLVAALMPLIILFYMYTANYMEDLEAGKIEWRLFSTELQAYLHSVDSIQITHGNTGLRVVQAGVEYDIEVYGSFIRKQKFNQGHEIMMTGISQCSFQLEGDVLKITAVLLSGSEERYEYAITGP
ncbi:competence type IV pilus minor pilin ComGF [Metaplanococcus flavidus]|uniref:Competence type IV pilus minor pilin ComGF n=1 Tax=Metaplanococcus flavidus TaxID=569883 RepID=A0ABW3LAM0_9BACL